MLIWGYEPSTEKWNPIQVDSNGVLQVFDPKVGSLISYEGTTTADGAGDGTTLICSDLTTKPDYNGNLVIITSGDYQGQARDINGVTTGGTVTPASAFGGLIVEGTTFVIVGIRTVPAEVADIKTQTDKIAGKMLFSMDFWSDLQEEVAVTSTAGDKALPSVVIADLPGTATIVRAVAMFKFRMVENTHADNPNNLVLDQYIQVKKSGQSYTNAIKMIDTGFTIAASTREGGDVIIGNIDLAAVNQVDANATYECQWTDADAAENNLQFNDVQVGLRIWYSV